MKVISLTATYATIELHDADIQSIAESLPEESLFSQSWDSLICWPMYKLREAEL